ncbi:hypothetical protein Q9L58_010913, partial [Maublancomyces gigas]
MPSALEDLLDSEDKPQFQNLEIVIKSKRKGGFQLKEKFMQILEGNGGFRSVYESIDLACDNIKLDVEIGGRLRRINLGKQQVSSDVDISDDVDVDESGFPTLQSWYDQADELSHDLFNAMGVDVA